ncbi:uncharacterized protein LOC130811402 [Amaranthus tricolor]|uniref:uncharacterized protein LOC130811402 n=1 Tax=Amaranthus tricolor TaxID=29722 RepID=UPI00258706C9|nr:uncharacterized protein LOC130811402 [Amaranthus tricolor]
MEQVATRQQNGMNKGVNGQQGGGPWEQQGVDWFQMPVHYPKYSRADYETMPEWRIDCLLTQYGLPVSGDLDHKRKFAMGAFLW